MIPVGCQRWRNKRTSYRPTGETIRPADYEVVSLDTVGDARAFVETHHYSGSWVADRFRFGLYHRSGELVGVAVYSTPSHKNVIANWFPSLDNWRHGVELGRFVLLDKVRANGETFFLSQCHRQLQRKGIRAVVSFADPVQRTDADGVSTFGGHIGTIYQAASMVLSGRGKGQTLRLFADGRTFHRRNRGKIINLDPGWAGAVNDLERRGAPRFEGDTVEQRRAWLQRALATTTRTLRHPGNLRYLCGLDRWTRRDLPVSDPYPKLGAVA